MKTITINLTPEQASLVLKLLEPYTTLSIGISAQIRKNTNVPVMATKLEEADIQKEVINDKV